MKLQLLILTFAGLGLALLTACSSAPLPLRARYLGEAIRVTNSGETGQNSQNKRDLPRLPEKFTRSCGIIPSATGTQLVLVRYFYYWNNVSSGNVRSHEAWTVIAPGLSVQEGNVLEVEIRAGVAGLNSRCPTVAAVLYQGLASGGCKYRNNGKSGAGSTIDIFNLFGGPGHASLDCPGLDKQGWIRPKPTATGMSVWVKPSPDNPGCEECGYVTP